MPLLEDFLDAAKNFVEISNRVHDGWKLYEDNFKTYLKKEIFIPAHSQILKAEYIIFFNLSYGVPAFSFNIWNSSGVLITLADLRDMAFIRISEKDFYSVITQQEHPIFGTPYFIMHPCHTEMLLDQFKESKNIIVTFLGLITPLIRLNLPSQYGL